MPGMLHPSIRVDFKMTLDLNELEWLALDALVGYGTDAFLKVFYRHLGQSYLKPHEAGLRALFDTVHKHAGAFRSQVQETRKVAGIMSAEVRRTAEELPPGSAWGADYLSPIEREQLLEPLTEVRKLLCIKQAESVVAAAERTARELAELKAGGYLVAAEDRELVAGALREVGAKLVGAPAGENLTTQGDRLMRIAEMLAPTPSATPEAG